MSRPLRKSMPLAVGLLVVSAIVYAFWPGAIDVDLAAAERGPMVVTVDREGKTRIKDRYVVSAPLSGRLSRITLRPGDAVERDQTILAVIEPTDPALLDVRARAEAEARVHAATARTKQAHANLDAAKAAHDLSRQRLDRARALYLQRGISREDYDDAEHRERIALEELRAAEFGVRIADFEQELAQAALLRSRPHAYDNNDFWRFDIPSPIGGRVLRVLQESAVIVQPGLPLLELGDPADLECVIDLLTSDAVKVKPGAKVILEDWGGPHPLHGRVRLTEPSAFTRISALGIEEQRVNVIVDFVDPLPLRQALGDAFRVEARIVIDEAEDVLKVPAGALFRHAAGWALFVVDGGRARLRPVTPGRSNGLEIEIVEGLEAGEKVVLHPGDRVEDGNRVTPRSGRK